MACARLHNGQNFENFEKVKFITTALKSILNLVKLQSLVVKCCYHYRENGINFSCVIQNLQTSQVYIFHILQHGAY